MSSGAFARVGLGAAVAVVIGISTFGPLLKQLAPTQGANGLVAGVALVPSDNPPPQLSGRALTDAVGGALSSPVRASASNRTDVSAGAAPQTEPPTAGIAAPSAPVVAATSASAFPPMQTMSDEGARFGEPTAQPTQPTASASSRPRGAEKSTAKRVADTHATKKKRPETPRPFGIREFLAGRW